MRQNKAFVIMRGGLGNQMFIYSFSKYLEQYNKKVILVWYEYLFTKHHHGVELFSAFDLEMNKDAFKYNFFLFLSKLFKSKLVGSILGRLLSMYYLFSKKIIQETPYSFISSINEVEENNLLFDGFWQNSNFLELANARELFKFRLPVKYESNETFLLIKNVESVSVHIRRGDYLENTFIEFQVIKGIGFYNKAINQLRNELYNPLFFIFSDDFIWAKQNIKGEDIIYVDENKGNKSFLDMFLMSQCKNNIISNSTFSFWGAYLNKNLNKKVICPDYWTKTVKSQSFCPAEWNFIEV
jgi:hypothetical protein